MKKLCNEHLLVQFVVAIRIFHLINSSQKKQDKNNQKMIQLEE